MTMRILGFEVVVEDITAGLPIGQSRQLVAEYGSYHTAALIQSDEESGTSQGRHGFLLITLRQIIVVVYESVSNPNTVVD
jgi:hypothetical protein